MRNLDTMHGVLRRTQHEAQGERRVSSWVMGRGAASKWSKRESKV